MHLIQIWKIKYILHRIVFRFIWDTWCPILVHIFQEFGDYELLLPHLKKNQITFANLFLILVNVSNLIMFKTSLVMQSF